MVRRSTMQMVIAGFFCAATAGLTGCEDEAPLPPESLEAPVSMAVATGEVCLPDVTGEEALIPTEALPRCEDAGQHFGLVVNQRSARVAVAALGQEPQVVANLDARRPGITHIPVADRPVDIAVNPDGTAAVVASEVGSQFTGIDLWTLRPLEQTLEIEGMPKVLESFGDGSLAALTRSPNRIEIQGGLHCERPDGTVDRRDHLPEENCEWSDDEAQAVELPGRPVDMSVDTDAHRAFVVYRDRNEVSWVALSDEGLGDDECLDDEAQAPCEVERVEWEENGSSSQEGATEVDADALGAFVYVLDRPNNQMLVFDRQRRQLIDVAQAKEPADDGGDIAMSIVESSTAMSAHVERVVLAEGPTNHVVYQFGAFVASNNGQLYEVTAADVECLYEGEAPLESEQFLFDATERAESDEARCLELPEFPLGGDPWEDEDAQLEELRFVEGDDVEWAITPIFGRRDADPEESTIIEPVDCELPDEMGERLQDADADVECTTGAMPQPVGLGVDDGLDDYSEESTADLVEFVWAIFDEDFERVLERLTYDERIVDEDWTVTYEGVLPDPGATDTGLVDRDDGSIFLSGGTDYCGAGVRPGDHLTITSAPVDDPDCEQYLDEEADFLTYEVVEVRPFEAELAIIDDEDFVDELPTRGCFDEGLGYEVRPQDEWIVVGSSTGFVSSYEASEDQCVPRQQPDEEDDEENDDNGENGENGEENNDEPEIDRFDSRVETGGEFFGPYLRFRIRQGDVEPVRDTQYIFGIDRNFSLAAESFVPDEQETFPAKVLHTPPIGGRWFVAVVDFGGDRVYLRDISVTDGDVAFVR